MSRYSGSYSRGAATADRRIRAELTTETQADRAAAEGFLDGQETADARPTGLRALVDADRESLLDTVDWLAQMNQDAFAKHVRLELRGVLDPEACRALRHHMNLKRWEQCLHELVIELNRQLAAPAGKTAAKQDWRTRAINFQALVLKRRAEVRALLRQQWYGRRSTSEERLARDGRNPGQIAVHRLIELHRAEFLVILAEEHQKAGTVLPDNRHRELSELSAAELYVAVKQEPSEEGES